MRTRNLIFIVIIAFSLPTLPASAQSDNSLRVAGNELRFRVIERFPAGDDWPWSASARAAFERGDWEEAFQAIKPAQNPDYAFAYGYAAYKSGRHSTAQATLTNVAENRGALLRDYAALYAAESALAEKKYDEAQRLAALVSPNVPIHGDAIWVLARALSAASPDSEATERALRGFIGTYGNHRNVSEAKLGLATLHLNRGDTKKAAAVFYDIVKSAPLSTEASAAATSLAAIHPGLDKATKSSVDLSSAEVTMSRAEALFSAHRSEKVISELSKVWGKLESERKCRALYLIARSHTKLRQHSDSLPWYDRLLEKCPDQSWQRRGLYLGGKGAWNAGKRATALTYFEKLFEDHSDHSYADDALYFSARIQREEDRPEAAEALLERQVKEHPSGDMAKDAHWLLVRKMLEAKNYSGVVKYVEGLQTTGEDDLYTKGRLAYFRARALELAGQKDKARAAYVDVSKSYPLSHYALFALNRLHSGKGDIACRAEACGLETKNEPLPASRADLMNDPRYLRAQTLLAIELASLARGELASLRRQFGEASDLWRLADRLDAAGAYPISHDITRRHIEGWANHYPTPKVSRRWEIAYPRPFLPIVKKWTQPKPGVDWALAFAIMREESGFSPSIESWANARGLMQLIEPTAERMAKRENMAKFSTEKLFEPDTAIRLGTAYLGYLAEKTAEHPALVIAGYNGGWGNVSSWLDDPNSSDLDLWIEDIPYGQTRKYTKRVLQTYWTYRFLYEDGEVPRLSMRLK